MPEQPRSERETQNRVIALFSDPARSDCLGYTYLGNWKTRKNNRAIEVEYLQANLKKRGYQKPEIDAAIAKLETAAAMGPGDSLYQVNMRTYRMLRYGISVATAVDQPHQQVLLIDWADPQNNDFAIAEEVTLRGKNERRPDLVLYLNGIAIGVIELKRAAKDVSKGISQLISNQEDHFNQHFFSTAQILWAGNDTDGLRYGTVRTPQELYVQWKVERAPATPLAVGALLDEPLAQMCNKERLLDFLNYFIIFDAGRKKVPRLHQYQGLKAAQERIRKQEGGVVWHTQGSGKSILMVLLAKWLLEYDPRARILVVTDRDELDRQIESVMRNAGVIGNDEASIRIASRKDFVSKLGEYLPRVMCALIHKFTPDLSAPPPRTTGQFYVFVDECHRTQGGDLHKQMQRWLPHALFIGFTGTPLLVADERTTISLFGSFIHTYKYDEAVRDKVVLDLKYEARAVPQRLTSKKAIDDWFDQKTRGLNNYKRAMLRKRWATMEDLMSSAERKRRIIANISQDFVTVPRLSSDRGNAILAVSSIYDACHYFRIAQESSELKGKCALITSFDPSATSISTEPKDSDKYFQHETYLNHLLKPSQSREAYEADAKRRFQEEPANMKLLIVVSKLLTGFDAPSCTYIYLDHKLQKHNLFQAICRTNRLDGEDKEYGHIVDYMEMLEQVQESIAIYTSDELAMVDDSGNCGNVKLKDWLHEGRTHLETVREALRYLCEPVPLPRESEQFVVYFCGDSNNPDDLRATEPLRISLYKAISGFVRAYSEIASNLAEAGFSEKEITELQNEVAFYSEIRSIIKRLAGEEFDSTPYERDMRHLINSYIQADYPEELGNLSSLSLVEMIVESGIHDAIAKKLNLRGNMSQHAIAEGIINNVRKTIIRNQLTDPKFYDLMSKLLEDLIKQKRQKTISYEAFLEQMEKLTRRTASHEEEGLPPELRGKPPVIAIYNNLDKISGTTFRCPENEAERAALALAIDAAVRDNAPEGWKTDETRKLQLLNALFPLMAKDKPACEDILAIIEQREEY